MPIPVTCPSCGTILAAPETAAGKRAKCRTCQTILTIPNPEPAGLDIVDEATTVVETPIAAAFVPPAIQAPAAFSFDEPAPKPKKRARDENEEDEERPRKKRRRDEDDEDDDEKPRGKRLKEGKKGNALVYILGAAVAALVFLLIGVFGVYWLVIREKPVVIDTSPLLKPKPTFVTKSTGKAAPPGWEVVDDTDFQVLLPKTGFNLEKVDIPIPKNEDYPELGEVRIVGKEISRSIDAAVIVFSLRRESLAQINKDPKRAVGTWSDIFLIKVPADDVSTTDFNNAEFNYKGRQYSYKHERGLKYYYRMFVAHDKFYVLRVAGDDINERSEYVKMFFDSFNPTR